MFGSPTAKPVDKRYGQRGEMESDPQVRESKSSECQSTSVIVKVIPAALAKARWMPSTLNPFEELGLQL
jgi:hypothetical protein